MASLSSRLVFGAALLLAGLAGALDVARDRPELAWLVAAAGLSYVAAVVAWIRERRPLIMAAVALTLLGTSAFLELSVHHAKLLPAAALAAWLVARTRRRRIAPADEHEAACGVVAAAYVVSAIAKLSASGGSWFAAANLGLLVAERSGEGPSLIRTLRLSVALSPTLCVALAIAAIAIEAGALSFLWPRARRAWALAATAMHVGIALLLGYVYVPWVVLILGLAFLPPMTEPATRRS